MMKKYHYVFCLILLAALVGSTATAQVTEDTDTEDLIQTTAETTDAEIDFTSELENLAMYQKKKINLNKTTYEELLNLVFLDEIQIQALLKYRETLGDFISIYELQAVPSWQLADIYRILPYVTIIENPYTLPITIKNLASEGTHELVGRTRFVVQNPNGYDKTTPGNKYLGNKYAHFVRYRYRFDNRISAGFTAEKDAGEQFFKDTQHQGFDFYSAHLEINNLNNVVKKVVIGDFQAQFGQGLNMWSGLAFGKSPMVMTTKRQAQGIRSYRSANEAAFFRGVAATIRLGKVEVSPFFSSHKLDSRIDTTADGDDLFEGSVSSFLVGGLHRTPSELSAKNQLSQRILGINAKYNHKLSSIGFTTTYTNFAYPFAPSDRPYKFFDFTGKNLLNISIDYKHSIKNLTLFGETAKSIAGGWATLNGALLVLDNNLAISVLHRNYARNYQSFWANAFGESTRPKNEKGLYVGATYTPFSKINISVFTDSYRYDWLRYQTDAPTAGTDYFAEVRYKYSRKAQYYARYRYRSVPKNMSTDFAEILPQTDNNVKHQFRLNASYKLQDLSLQTRLENTFITDQNGIKSTGFVAFQDLNYKALNIPVSFNFRYAIFNCPTYDSRIYAYENDVLYFYSIPAYYGTGSRIYALTRVVVGNHLDFWVRYAHTWYTDRTTINSGLEAIQGNLKSEIKLQMRLQF